MLGILTHQKEAPAETLVAEVPRGMRGNGPRSILRRREDPGLQGRGLGGNPMTTMGVGKRLLLHAHQLLLTRGFGLE
jgi:hypothetical protein